MADIILTCPACRATLKLSEYAKPDNLACPACHAPLVMPEPERRNTPDQILPEHVRRAKAEAEAARLEKGDQPEVELMEVVTSIHSRHRKRRKVHVDRFATALKGFILFFVLGAILVYLRYYKGYMHLVAENELDTIRVAGALAILFFHAVIVIEAFTLDFLTGLFCLVIPGYSIYYLFTESDSFWLRAVVAALVVGFGRDFFEYARDYLVGVYNFINAWLAAGAEMNKPVLK